MVRRSGPGDPVMTAHVVHGLKIAGSTAKIPGNMLLRAVSWLTGHQNRQLALLVKGTPTGNWKNSLTARQNKKAIRKLGDYRLTASASDVLIYSVLAGKRRPGPPNGTLPVPRQAGTPGHQPDPACGNPAGRPPHGRLQGSHARHLQFLQQDDSLQTAWLRLPTRATGGAGTATM